ncbi:MAG TPA: hypothetical protein VHJ78_04760 [Actinomycetota bacterium]|nr:hypothetical protein [Actinomycetota bacterium]
MSQVGRVGWYEIRPEPTPAERRILLAALEVALATEAREIPASGWSSPQYQDGTSLRPGMRIWTAGDEADAARKPDYPFRRRS